MEFKILLGGNRNITSQYEGWITGAMTAKVSCCLDHAHIMAALKLDAPDLLILDLTDSGFIQNRILPQARKANPDLPIFVTSSSKAVEDAVNAFHQGATDYMSFPVDRTSLIEKIRQVLEGGEGSEGAKTDQGSGNHDGDLEEELLFGTSDNMRKLREITLKIMDTDLPVLITGESGTGKEMVVKFIWRHSARRNMPFVKVNCAAIPSELLESELFGYEKGAFTGAYRRNPGKFEAADGGIIFLDEVSELPYSLQSKLLHVLQDGKFSTLGSNQRVGVDVRVIAATNRNLENAVAEKEFRGDLYFRLNVVNLHLPPLRERPTHIPALVGYFLKKYSDLYRVPILDLDEKILGRLSAHRWPGNIRELENIVRRATVLGGERFIYEELSNHPPEDETQSEPLTFNSAAEESPQPAAVLSLREIAKIAALKAERDAIEKVLEITRWNRKRAAGMLNISYKTLLSKIKETGLGNG
ncbi:MAG: sigma-54-dependent Fis family transcriptional regulator [Deltaproteobacteria bacterium]|nr:sigma-54-dependent Fis family transcriptional regulator [Deltaproteobacteria bacterium]